MQSRLGYLCVVCFTPIERPEHVWAVSRTLHDGGLYEGMYLIHRTCRPEYDATMAVFEAGLPTAADVVGILKPGNSTSAQQGGDDG